MIDCSREFVICTDAKNTKFLLDKPNVNFHYYANMESDNEFDVYLDYLKNAKCTSNYVCFISAGARCLLPVKLSHLLQGNDLVIFKSSFCAQSKFEELYGSNVGSICDTSNMDTRNAVYFTKEHFIARPKAARDLLGFVKKLKERDDASGVHVDNFQEKYFNFCINYNINSLGSIMSVKVNDGKIYCNQFDDEKQNCHIRLEKPAKITVFSCFLNESVDEMLSWYKSISENYLVNAKKKFVIYTNNEIKGNEGFGADV